MVAVPESGLLDQHPVPCLLLDLFQGGFGGALTLSRERIDKRFLFQQGVPVFAESNLASESLGVQLLDARRISRADFNRVGAHIEQTGCKEGAALLELGLLQPKELFLALKEQVRTRLIECFGWPHGRFQVDASCETPSEAQPFRVDIYSLLQEGIEAHWPGDRVLMGLAPRMQRYPIASKRFDRVAARLRRDAAVESLLAAIDGQHSLWQAVQLAVTRRALAAAWLLDAAGALDYRDGAAISAPEPEVELIVDQGDAGAMRRGARASTPTRAAAPRNAARVDALKREVEERYARLGGSDHYGLLGLERKASTAEIKRAYLVAAKSYHPDALARLGLDPETRERANRVFAEISKAHAVLLDPQRRRSYDSTLDTDSTAVDANRLAQAETLYRKAEILMRQGNFRGAVDFLRGAVELWPDECAYQSAYGWALYKKMPSEPEAARDHLQHALRLDPDDGISLFRLSVVLRDLGDAAGAAALAERAQQIDPGRA